MILLEKILWRVSFCLPFNFVGHYLRLEKAWFLKISCSGNSLISICIKTKDQNSKISTESYSFGYQRSLANGSLPLLSLSRRRSSVGTKKALSCIGNTNLEKSADLISIGNLLNLSEKCKRKTWHGLLSVSRVNWQNLALTFVIILLPNICVNQKLILKKHSDGWLSCEIIQNIPLALISLWHERSSSNQYMYLSPYHMIDVEYCILRFLQSHTHNGQFNSFAKRLLSMKLQNMSSEITIKSSAMSLSKPSNDLVWKTNQRLSAHLGKILSAKEQLAHFVEIVLTIWLFLMKSIFIIFCMNTSLNITMSAELICHSKRIRRFTALLRQLAKLSANQFLADCTTSTAELLKLKI